MKRENMIRQMIKISNHCRTNAYLIDCNGGKLLFDTGEEGSFSPFLQELSENKISIEQIKWVMISHFHADHVGLVEELVSRGVTFIVFGEQKNMLYEMEYKKTVEKEISESRDFLHSIGIDGEVIATPGHSDDSISLYLDNGSIFVGDLPVFVSNKTRDKVTQNSIKKVKALHPRVIYYGHGMDKTRRSMFSFSLRQNKSETYYLVKKIMKYIDRGESVADIHKKTGADLTFIEDINRMYLTHQNVGVQGILDRIEIKNK